MDLAERAIAAYKKEQKLIEESNMKAAELFADKALKELQEIIGVQYDDIMAVDKQLYYASFRVGSMLFGVTTSECFHIVNMIQRCQMCGSDVNTRILNIKDIGKVLTEPHNKYDCDQAIEIKEKMEKMKRDIEDGNEDGNEDGGVLSTDEKLLAAFKDFISEHGHMCSSI